jgi:hypothetical protein
MGMGFVLAFWAIVGGAGACIGALALRSLTSILTREERVGPYKTFRTRALRIATVLPFACLMWAGAVFVLQAVINATYLHRDIGIGDSSYCPLPNGYSILLIDVDDQGTVYNPKTQLRDDSVADKEDAVSGVRSIQVAGVYILGAADSRYSEHFAQNNPTLDRYFILDTRTGTRTDFKTDSALRETASKLGVNLSLEPISKLYSRYRFTWFDIAAALLLVLPPVIAVALLARSILRLRRLGSRPSGETGVPLPAN